MSKKDEALKLAQDLRTLAERFSKGWHDGIKIDASDIILLTDAAEALAEQPAPPPECQTEAEKTAFAFGWWKALESVRQQPAQQQAAFTIYDGKGNVVVHLDAKPAQQEPFGYFRYDLRLDAWVQNRAGLTGTPFYISPPAQQNIRNATLDEIANKIEAMPFGDTAASFAVWIREQKT